MVGEESGQTRVGRKLNKKEVLVVASLLLVGLLLRIFRIGTREIAYDDAFSFFLASKNFITIIQGTVADTMPPLYYFLLSFMIKISHELWFLRLLNVVINLLSIFLLYLLAKELLGKEVGYVAVLLAILSPFMIYHSQELRMYSLLLLGQVGYLYSLVKLSRYDSRQKLYFVSAIIFGLIAIYSHNLAFVGIFACNFVFFINRSKKIFYSLCAIQISLLILFIPWAVFLPQQIAKVQTAFWTTKPGVLELIQTALTLFGFAPMAFWKIILFLLLFFENLVVASIWFVRSKETKVMSLLAIGLAQPVILFLLSYLTRPVFVPRIFIFSTFIAYLLIGEFIVKNWTKIIAKISLFSIIIAVLITLPDYYFYQSFPRSSFSEAVHFIDRQNYEPKIVLHENKLSYFPMMFYDSSLQQSYLADPQGSENDTLALESQYALGHLALSSLELYPLPEKLFFVTFAQTEIEYQELNMPDPNLNYLQEYYHQTGVVTHIGDIVLYYFESANE
jgi:uncharacterized membrane protein